MNKENKERKTDIISIIKDKFVSLPEDLQMAAFAVFAIPGLFLFVTGAYIASHVVLTPEMIPGAFDSSGNIKHTLIFEILSLLVAPFVALTRGTQDGGFGIVVVAMAYAFLLHFSGMH